MNRKRTFILVLAFAMTLSLAACGGKTGSAADSQNAQPAAGQVADAEGFVAFDVSGEVTLKSLKLDKTQYKNGDTIIVTVKADGVGEACSAWVGILPASVAHGSEDENDKYDIDFYYLTSLENGTAEFNVQLDAGKYDIRVFDSDDDGVELGYIGFEFAN